MQQYQEKQTNTLTHSVGLLISNLSNYMFHNIPFPSDLYTSTSHKVSTSDLFLIFRFFIRRNRPLIGSSHIIVDCPGGISLLWVKHKLEEALTHFIGFCENTSMSKSWSLYAVMKGKTDDFEQNILQYFIFFVTLTVLNRNRTNLLNLGNSNGSLTQCEWYILLCLRNGAYKILFYC